MEHCRYCSRDADWVVTTRTSEGEWRGLEVIKRPEFLDTEYVCGTHVTETYEKRKAAVSAQNEDYRRLCRELHEDWRPHKLRAALRMEVHVYRSLAGYYAPQPQV